MSNKQLARESDETQEVDGGRQRELRALLVSAADAARQSRQAQRVMDRAGRPMGRPTRERVSMLLSAAG